MQAIEQEIRSRELTHTLLGNEPTGDPDVGFQQVELHGTDPDAAAALYEAEYESRHVRFEPDAEAFFYSYRVTGDRRVTLRSSTITARRSGMPRPVRQYILGWSNQSGFTVEDDSSTAIEVDRGVPVMLPLGRALRVIAPAGTMQFLHFEASFLEDVAALVSGEPPESLTLPMMIDPEAVGALRGRLCGSAPALLSAATTARARQALDIEVAEAVLEAFAPSRLERDPRAGRSAVDRAKDAMLEYYAEQLTVAEVARAAGVSVRTLQQAFLGETGAGPMRYLHELRLAKCRLALRRSDPGATVADVARSCGFRHMGRFAGDYVARFDEYPSDTIRRHW